MHDQRRQGKKEEESRREKGENRRHEREQRRENTRMITESIVGTRTKREERHKNK